MMEDRLKKHAFFKDYNLDFAYDSLTGVLNRDAMCSYINYLIEKEIPFSFCLSDVDNFKYVNDTYGHLIGDKVLAKFAKIICSTIADKGIVARFGGDEFMIVIENVVDYDGIWNILHDLNFSIPNEIFDEVGDLNLTLTTGTSRFPNDAKSYEGLFETADKALYRGKTKGRNCFIIYLEEKHANIKLKSSNDQQLNALDLHAQLFDFLAKKENLALGIKNLFRYFSSNLMLDHICIETKDDMYFSTVHQISATKNFKHLDYKLFTKYCSSIGLYYLNNRKTMLNLNLEVKEALEEQDIVSIIYCKITAYGKEYGSLRAGMSLYPRIWQSGDIDLLLTAARVIGIILHYQNKEIKDL